jgi:Tripartite ATP-independent periplasmic transporter, DctM component
VYTLARLASTVLTLVPKRSWTFFSPNAKVYSSQPLQTSAGRSQQRRHLFLQFNQGLSPRGALLPPADLPRLLGDLLVAGIGHPPHGAALLLYNVGVFATVHLEAEKGRLPPVPVAERLPLGGVLRSSFLILPIVGLVILLILGYTPVFSGMAAIGLSIAVGMIRAGTRMGPHAVFETLRQAGFDASMIAVAIVAAGIIVAVIAQTGLGLAFSSLFISLSGGGAGVWQAQSARILSFVACHLVSS